MQDKEYTVAAVSTQKAPRQWGTKVAMLEYLVKFEEDAEKIVKLSKKASDPAPVKGDKVTGHIETNEYGWTFKRIPGPGAGGRWQPRDTKDIRAQMAVKAAADYCAQTGQESTEIGPLAHHLYQLVDEIKAADTKDDAAKSDDLKSDVEAALGDNVDEVDLSEIPF